ncbi:hypothetical protein HGM15179_015631 [Zosterops borbonicus]|uniref:Uncharacterized protein n=1 Tax=Zosterops borbonicus TaxID=364589 RepID=A0A8K1LF38_9PASS|nr:hypothetical protein HGM15179_015631 [Zosterops borbonicus]
MCAPGDGRHADNGRRPGRYNRPWWRRTLLSTAGMEMLSRVILEIYVQWGINILYSECWVRCTNALARDVLVSASSKNLKSWGKVMKALQKALEEQETWAAAQKCLRLTPRLGIGAATQTVFENDRAEKEQGLETDNLSRSLLGSPGTESERVLETNSRSRSSSPVLKSLSAVGFNPSENPPSPRESVVSADLRQIDMRPPPYAPQHGAEAEEEGRSSVKFRATDTRGCDYKGGGAVLGGEEKSEPNWRTGSPAIPFKAEMPLERRRSRRSGTPAHQKPRGRSQSKKHRRQEVSDQSTSSHLEEEKVEQVSKPVREGWCKGREYRE